MPGYEVDAEYGFTYINFGDYADIHDSYTPDVECPMPESERLSNYIMRLLAVAEQAGFRWVQRTEKAEKVVLQGILDELINHNGMLGQIQSRLYDISQALSDISSNADLEDIKTILDTALIMASGSSVFQMDTQSRSRSTVVSVAILLYDVWSVVQQLKGEQHLDLTELTEYVEGVNQTLTDLNTNLASALLQNGKSMFGAADEYGAERRALEEILGEVQETNDNDEVFEIGSDSYYLKSKVVTHG